MAARSVSAVAIVIGLVLSSCGGSPATGIAPKGASTAGAGSSPIPPGPGALVAQVMRRTTMRAKPGGRVLGRVGPKTEFGSPDVLLVARRTNRWLAVVSALSGNRRLGWIPLAATALSRVTTEIRVSLAARRLTVLYGGRVLRRYTVAIGRPDAPTPTGTFAVTDRLATDDPSGPYGCCIIALSAHAPHAIQGWGGGTRIAIHSTPEVSTIGEPVSHGCVRLTIAEANWLMYHIPLGTPTIITS